VEYAALETEGKTRIGRKERKRKILKGSAEVEEGASRLPIQNERARPEGPDGLFGYKGFYGRP
jgi:hypothetical protein